MQAKKQGLSEQKRSIGHRFDRNLISNIHQEARKVKVENYYKIFKEKPIKRLSIKPQKIESTSDYDRY